ncbi:hypothetical protein QZH41_005815 [Actinostola sp. cb2023]|nr:hypothetical protein QZH41_005815 [Actinostola sp. cb2023]
MVTLNHKHKWDGGPIVQIGWSANEDLLCISVDGSVSMYDIHGSYQRTFSMGQDAKESKVIDSKIFRSTAGAGIAILTGNYHFFAINNVDEVRSRKLVDPPNLNAPPTSWLVMPQDRGSQALVAIDSQLYLIDTGQCIQQYPSFREPVTSIIDIFSILQYPSFREPVTSIIDIFSILQYPSFREPVTSIIDIFSILQYPSFREPVTSIIDIFSILQYPSFREPVTSIIEMALSCNGSYLAMFTDTGLVWIGSSDVQKVYCEVKTQCLSRPKQLSWLVLRRHYCLAIRICDYLKIAKVEGASRILGHWACYKVQQTNVDDEDIAQAINAKLGESTGISYTEIASKALECGRTHLAIRYCKQHDRRILVDLYYQEDNFLNSGNVYLQDSFAETTLESRIKLLTKAQMSYTQGNHPFYAKCTEEHMKLLEYQTKLENELRKPFVDLSLSDTISQPFVDACLESNNQLEAEKYLSRVLPENKVVFYLKMGDDDESDDCPPKVMMMNTAPKVMMMNTAPKVMMMNTAPKVMMMMMNTAPKVMMMNTAPKVMMMNTAPKVMMMNTAPKHCP